MCNATTSGRVQRPFTGNPVSILSSLRSTTRPDGTRRDETSVYDADGSRSSSPETWCVSLSPRGVSRRVKLSRTCALFGQFTGNEVSRTQSTVTPCSIDAIAAVGRDSRRDGLSFTPMTDRTPTAKITRRPGTQFIGNVVSLLCRRPSTCRRSTHPQDESVVTIWGGLPLSVSGSASAIRTAHSLRTEATPSKTCSGTSGIGSGTYAFARMSATPS